MNDMLTKFLVCVILAMLFYSVNLKAGSDWLKFTTLWLMVASIGGAVAVAVLILF